ncbi:MAG: hypothetical protein B7C55_07725 [Actinomycetales bacterium mxb001]|nr:MAG: hypothetical protein B7C55_07725 [Actinomycetales bacterium mxb001]
MRFGHVVSSAVIGLLLSTGLIACATPTTPTDATDPQALATELIDRYAVAVFDRDQEALGNLLSDAYVLRRADGSGYDRQGYLAALAEGSDYDLVNYEITDVQARQDGDILVASFLLEAEILEGGQPVTSEPSYSLVTFVRVDGEWKLASDAFFSQ